MNERWRRPESVLVVVYTSSLEFLLLERVRPPGFWQSVTGTLEWGETPAQAARRELREETGLSTVGLRDGECAQRFAILPEWRSRYAADVDTNLEHVWYLELPAIVAVTLNPAEHSRYDWLGLDAALERVSSWTNRDAIAACR
ncbi:MAG: dihydroneopterin triphosphate diphosphatase [Gammaproteobacteria bacterium]|jgi:dATP pyrophosphohydrolase